MSIQDLQQNPQDTSNFYLANIYQATINPNNPNISDSHPASPPPFSPPNSAVWVNALWFLSLVISLTCALLATLLQQWARRYLKITQSRYAPDKRARIRAFFSEGVEKCLLPWAVDALPTLLHISLFLFFAGLVVFLCNVHLTIFKLVLSWVSLCAALYGCITCMPIIRHDSPYYTPLSLPAWQVATGTLFFIYRFLRWFNGLVRFRFNALDRFQKLEESCRRSLVRGMQKTAEETALNSPSEIDTRAFMWTFDCLDEDGELARFFSGLPDFRRSNIVKDPVPSLADEEKSKLYGVLRGLLDRTFASDLLPAPVKNRRVTICAKAVDLEHTPEAIRFFKNILSKYQYSGPVATIVANALRGRGKNMEKEDLAYSQFAISKIIVTRQPFDDSWYSLASKELNSPETRLREYAANGDSLSLFILIRLVRQQFIHFREPSWRKYDFSRLLTEASELDAQNALPKLQHKFCAIWNQIVYEVQNHDDRSISESMLYQILAPIRKVFFALHQVTDYDPTPLTAFTHYWDPDYWNSSLYPVCKVPDHSLSQTSWIYDEYASTITVPIIPAAVTRTASFSSISSVYPPSSTHFLPRAPSDDLSARSSSSPPILDAILPTGVLLFSAHDSI